jgi:hypothetical protein
VGAPRARALAMAAVRETFEETPWPRCERLSRKRA